MVVLIAKFKSKFKFEILSLEKLTFYLLNELELEFIHFDLNQKTEF